MSDTETTDAPELELEETTDVDALVSFTFNCGEGALAASTLRKRLNRREYAAVPSELNKWVLSGGKKLEGLVRRRKAEGALFSKGRYK